ncbi:MAG: hemolysin family protein [Phycisphaerales bacterium]|nr:hemolysin family protein [Phycisphaerales bacterium]
MLGNLLFLILLLVLLAISAVFSGMETVLFSLSRYDLARMKKSANRMEILAASLRDHPRALLTSLLVGNMTCTLICLVLSSLLLARLNEAMHTIMPATWLGYVILVILALIPPLLVTYLSDIFPKVIGAQNNTRLAPLIALPVATLVRILWPLSATIETVVMRPMHRLIGTRDEEGGGGAFSTDELRELLEMSEKQGVIDVSENELLQEVVRIADLKVRDVMTPRVDITAFNIKDPSEKLIALFQSSHLNRILTFDGQIDHVTGMLYGKTVMLEATAPGLDVRRLDLRKLIQPVRYVPEQQSLDQLLHHFRQTRTQLAVVVDEFGGLIGVVTLTDVVEQMVGDIYEPYDQSAQAIERVGPDEYLVSGDLSMADWMDAFGARVETTHTTTVAGFLAAHLKRLPRAGDEVKLAHLSMHVESMRGRSGRRVDKVRLKLLTHGQSEAST